MALGEKSGFRNGQLSVLAPTGTIAFMMDCDTTGVEPDIALIKYKRLVGGGYLKIVNQGVLNALRKLGYEARQAEEIVAYIDEHETIEGAPHLKDEHLAVFDCAFKPANGSRSIHYNGHLKMMAAVQPFISRRHQQDGEHAGGLDPGGDRQRLHRRLEDGPQGDRRLPRQLEALPAAEHQAGGRDRCGRRHAGDRRRSTSRCRRRLPDERAAFTHKFGVGGHEGYLTVGLYEDGTPGEIFLKMAKEGSTISGLMDSFATAVSVALQYGVPLKDLVNKFSHIRFEPAGFTGNPEIPMAKSLVDYVFRYLGSKFLSSDEKDAIGIISQMTLTDVKASGGGATGTTASAGSAAAPHAASRSVDSGPARSAEETGATPAQPEAAAPEAQGTEETAAEGGSWMG